VLPSDRDIAEALDAHHLVDMPALPGRTNHLPSGVLLPLRRDDESLSCVATVRSPHLKHHAGEVCFPGGRPEPGDADLCATALREAHEELGIERANVLGVLSSVPLFTSDFRLHPFVARVSSQALVVNHDEVAAVLELEIASFLRRATTDAIAWSYEGHRGLSPVFEIGEHIMYGATAHAFFELLTVMAPLFGVAMPPLRAGKLTWADVLPPNFARPTA